MCLLTIPVPSISDVFTQSLYDDLVDINLNDFNLASVTTVPASAATTALLSTENYHHAGPARNLASADVGKSTLHPVGLPVSSSSTVVMTQPTSLIEKPTSNTVDYAANPAHSVVVPRHIEIGGLSLSVLPSSPPIHQVHTIVTKEFLPAA